MRLLSTFSHLGESLPETGLPIYVWIVPVIVIPGLLVAFKLFRRK